MTTIINPATAVLDSYNNYLYINIISKNSELNFNLSINDAVNLLENKKTKKSFEVRKNVDVNTKKAKVKPAIFAKYLGDNIFKVAIGKTNKAVKQLDDLNISKEYEIDNIEILMQAAYAQMKNAEKHKLYKEFFFKSLNKIGSDIEL